MPQHLTPAWVEALGENYLQIHENWLHRIANLTLTAYNSKYSNNSFADKCDMKNGFKESGIRMNQRIAQKTTWGLAELEERDLQLQQRALEIWAAPVTTYVAPEKQLDSFTLDDDVEFTGKTIARFSYKGMEQPVTSWVDMYQQVLKILHAEDKSVLSGLAYTTDDSVELALHVSSKESDFSKCIQIDNNVFVWSNTSTQYKITTLRRFFSMYGADAGDLVFYMKDDQDDDSSIEGTRYEIRRRYWQFAIPLVQKAHEETGCFSLVTKSKENWIAGSYGVSGCSVTCVANFDSARVEIYLGTSDKILNKKIFDAVFARKSVIESALSASLVWDRGEDKRSAKIAYELSGVSIANEDDWKRMASFHSEWSKKLYDEIVPIVLSAVQ